MLFLRRAQHILSLRWNSAISAYNLERGNFLSALPQPKCNAIHVSVASHNTRLGLYSIRDGGIRHFLVVPPHTYTHRHTLSVMERFVRSGTHHNLLQFSRSHMYGSFHHPPPQKK